MEPLPMALGQLMADAQLTETELAAEADISQGTVNKYLHRRRGTQMNPRSLRTVEKLADALGVAPDYFLEYRQATAERLVKEAMAAGLIDLEDIELILAGRADRARATEKGSL